MRRKVHLISNAHLDPVWQWDWPEGIGAALSTFKVAADFCEEFDRFVFCHNESVLYEWVEEYDPALFKRIQRLVAQGKWHIMGGWYLQPDCNMPAGESLVRQITKGRRYFWDKFGVAPTVAVSMDCFGHSKGLVQILQQAGYTGYMFMRPDIEENNFTDIPQIFCWEGYNNSKIKAFRLNASYNTLMGRAAEAISSYIENNSDSHDILRCWGVGDHGGGPSRKDIIDINHLIDIDEKNEIIHSTPEAFFQAFELKNLPVFSHDLNPLDVGCYTTMHKVKELHRRLENSLTMAEKLLSVCDMRGLMHYDSEKLEDAWTDLLFCQFHDILPGTSIKPAEEHAIQRLYHGLEITDRLINRALYAFAADEPAAQGKDIPICIVNPHPFEVTDIFECEYMLADQNWSGTFESADVYCGEDRVPSQVEKENSTINLDWRKKVSFYGTLKPLSVTRFNCRVKTLETNPAVVTDITSCGTYTIHAGRITMCIDTVRGCFTSFKIDGQEYGGDGFGRLLVYRDNFDPWLLQGRTIDEYVGEFTLLGPEESAYFGGSLGEKLSPIRITEDGDVRTCVEVLLGYGTSRAKVVYRLSKHMPSVEIDLTVQWNEKDRMVRLNIPHNLNDASYFGQDIFGNKVLSTEYEMVAQKWVMAVDEVQNLGVSIINESTYGSKLNDDSVEISLLRSPSYTCFHLEKNPPSTKDRSLPRIDRGEAHFRFTVLGGTAECISDQTDRIALIKNEAPRGVSYFPSGTGLRKTPVFTVEGVRMDACKKSVDQAAYVLRLFNTRNDAVKAHVVIEDMALDTYIDFAPLEMKTFRLSLGEIREVDLIQEI